MSIYTPEKSYDDRRPPVLADRPAAGASDRSGRRQC